jgi:hypothetical protein
VWLVPLIPLPIAVIAVTTLWSPKMEPQMAKIIQGLRKSFLHFAYCSKRDVGHFGDDLKGL